MTFSEIKELHEMGFSNEEIMKLNNSAITPGDQPAGDQPAGDQPAEDQPAEDQPAEDQPAGDQPAKDDSAVKELAALRKETADLKTEMNKFISAMQKNNLLTASLNMLPQDDLDKQTDAALSEIIRPTFKEKEGVTK